MRSSIQAALVTIPIVTLLLLFSPSSDAAVTCSTVTQDMSPCVTYLRGTGGNPPPPCCTGAQNLAAAASTTADKRTACQCLQNLSKSLNVNQQLAQALPAKCGIKVPYLVSPNTDCSTIT